MGPGDLARALEGLAVRADPNLIAGIEHFEDAGVYRLTEDLAVVQTLDFFTPIVDDPYVFGQVAAANALSDVYAMGGRPLTAMNIVCFPVRTMEMSVLNRILGGGLEKLHEAGVTLVGGHSVEDKELKYGLSITGVVHPDRVVLNTGAKAGDALILTKRLGTGIINTALKGEMASDEAVAESVKCMTTLNRRAAELMLTTDVHACTDVTGFGCLGHACEMIEGTDVGVVIDASAIPYITEAREYAEMGLLPGGLHRNRDYRLHMVEFGPEIPQYMSDILFDPQTSGGLLIAVAGSQAHPLAARMRAEGVEDATVIGEVVAERKGRVRVL